MPALGLFGAQRPVLERLMRPVVRGITHELQDEPMSLRSDVDDKVIGGVSRRGGVEGLVVAGRGLVDVVNCVSSVRPRGPVHVGTRRADRPVKR